MFNYFYDQNPIYSDCLTDGRCSMDPTLFSWQEIFLYELKQLSYYILKLKTFDIEHSNLIKDVIRGLSLVVINADFNKSEFENILQYFNHKKTELKAQYKNVCISNKSSCKFLKCDYEKAHGFDFAEAMKRGEQQCRLWNKNLDKQIKGLYELLLKLLKGASIDLFTLSEFGYAMSEAEFEVIKILSSLNIDFADSAKLAQKIEYFSKLNYEIFNNLTKAIEQKYGSISEAKVSSDIKQGKSILVSGQNYLDLEKVLEYTKDLNVNVYTHNGMLLAHQYEGFRKYPHLKGHYQNAIDNMSIDFASFNGTILLTKNYQHKIEQLLRGRIFTTDVISGKGITKIRDYDFEPLVKSLEETNGYLQDKKQDSVTIGYSLESVYKKLEPIIRKVNKGLIKHVIFIGLINNFERHKEYFNKLAEKLPEDYYIFSMSYNIQHKNAFHLNTYFDSSLVYKIIDKLQSRCQSQSLDMTVFINHCTYHTLSHIFSLKTLGVKNVFVGACSSTIINPGIMDAMKTIFNVKQVSASPEKDLKFRPKD